MFLGPCPRMFQELFARQVALVDALFLQALDDLCLGRDRCVVGTGHPAGVLALLTCAANQDVLYRLVEHVTHVQYARHIGGRDNYRISLTAVRSRMK